MGHMAGVMAVLTAWERCVRGVVLPPLLFWFVRAVLETRRDSMYRIMFVGDHSNVNT